MAAWPTPPSPSFTRSVARRRSTHQATASSRRPWWQRGRRVARRPTKRWGAPGGLGSSVVGGLRGGISSIFGLVAVASGHIVTILVCTGSSTYGTCLQALPYSNSSIGLSFHPLCFQYRTQLHLGSLWIWLASC
jgi:hypothetical protein